MSHAAAECSVTKVKLGGAVRTHQRRRIETSPQGAWLYAPEGTAVHHDTGELYTRHSSAGVQLLLPGEWWTAWWFADKRWIAVDVTFPVEEVPGGYRYTDLELDLWWRDGDCGIVDQDELKAAVVSGQIDRPTATTAERVAADLRDRLSSDQGFVERGFALLDERLGGPPGML